MGRKSRLPQIKLFSIDKYRDFTDMEKDVNGYIVEVYSRDGCTPSVDAKSSYIMVTRDTMVNTRYDEYNK